MKKNKKELHKKEIAQRISKNTGIPFKYVYEIINEFPKVVKIALLNGHDIMFSDFGKMSVRLYKGRTTHHPNPNRRGEYITTEDRYFPTFKFSHTIKNPFRSHKAKTNVLWDEDFALTYNPDGWKHEFYEEEELTEEEK